MSEVVTGDAVLLDVRIAQLPVRAVGALIDIVVILIGYLISLFLWAATLSELDGAATAGDTPSPFAFDLAQRSQMRGEDIAAASGARPSAIAEAFRHR